jgi:hypothetical protein
MHEVYNVENIIYLGSRCLEISWDDKKLFFKLERGRNFSFVVSYRGHNFRDFVYKS